MWASWPKVPIDTEYCCKTVVVEKPLFILSAINCPQREGMTIAMLHNIYKYKFPFSRVNKTVPTHKGITSVLVLQIRWNSGSAHPEVNGQEKVFHSWRATSASHGPSTFQHSPAHKTHDSARCGAGTERRANLDDELQLLAMLIILCNAPILMQSPIKKRFFFYNTIPLMLWTGWQWNFWSSKHIYPENCLQVHTKQGCWARNKKQDDIA